ncbi:hypothetical protein SDC9_84314 [bioreactor metagenome]|uniref:Uncharacterized protein n=1 Tax=bioreactor metagenome TaxID=1076179 RepID=A0A644Z9W5_9ZZZZ
MQEGPHDRRCALRAQCDRASAFVFKGVHFLLYDVCRVAHAALKKLSVFKDRCADLLIVEIPADRPDDALNIVPLVDLVRKHVSCTLRYSCQKLRHFLFPLIVSLSIFRRMKPHSNAGSKSRQPVSALRY